MRSSFTLTGHDDYSPAIADLICERLMEGASLRQIYQDRNMPARSIAITPRRLADIADDLTESELAGRRTPAAGGRRWLLQNCKACPNPGRTARRSPPPPHPGHPATARS